MSVSIYTRPVRASYPKNRHEFLMEQKKINERQYCAVDCEYAMKPIEDLKLSETEKKNLKKQKENLDKAVAGLKTANVVLKTELNKVESNFSTKIKSLETQNAALILENKDLRDEISAERKRLAAEEAEIQKLNGQNASLKNNLDVCNADVKTKDGELAMLREILKDEKENKVQLNLKMVGMTSEYQTNRKEIERLTKLLNDCNVQKVAAQDELNKKNAEIAETKSDKTLIEALQIQITKLQTTNAVLKTKTEDLEKELSNLQEKNDVLQSDKNAAEKSLSDSTARIAELEAKEKELNDKLLNVEEESKIKVAGMQIAHDTRIKVLDGEINNLKRREKLLIETNDQLQTKNNECEKELLKVQTENAKGEITPKKLDETFAAVAEKKERTDVEKEALMIDLKELLDDYFSVPPKEKKSKSPKLLEDIEKIIAPEERSEDQTKIYTDIQNLVSRFNGEGVKIVGVNIKKEKNNLINLIQKLVGVPEKNEYK